MKASGRDAGRDRNTAKWFRLYGCSRAGGQDSGVRHMAEKNENNAILTTENLSEVKRQLSSFAMSYTRDGGDCGTKIAD